MIGILLVLVFVVFYYNRAGFIADLALVVNLFFLLGVMASSTPHRMSRTKFRTAVLASRGTSRWKKLRTWPTC